MDNKNNKYSARYMPIGISLGMLLGVALGKFLFNNLALGIAFGVSFGTPLGLLFSNIKKHSDERNASTREVENTLKDE